MNELVPAHGSPFEAIKQMIDGVPQWDGRDLMPLLEYSRWGNFEDRMLAARVAIDLALGEGAGQRHIADSSKSSPQPNGGFRELPDYRLTRLGAYMTAQECDGSKKAVAEAKAYFAVRTHQAEQIEKNPTMALVGLDLTDMANVGAILQAGLAAFTRANELQVITDAQSRELETARPKATYVDRFVNGAGDTSLLGDFAAQVGMTDPQLRKVLVEQGIIYRKTEGRRWSTTKRKYIPEYSWHAKGRKHVNWFSLRDQPEAPRRHNGQLQTTLYITPVGKVEITKILVRLGLLNDADQLALEVSGGQ